MDGNPSETVFVPSGRWCQGGCRCRSNDEDEEEAEEDEHEDEEHGDGGEDDMGGTAQVGVWSSVPSNGASSSHPTDRRP